MGFKQARVSAGMTVADAAKALEVSEQAIFCWERGDYLPNSRRLTDVAKLYKCSIDELLSADQTEETARR